MTYGKALLRTALTAGAALLASAAPAQIAGSRSGSSTTEVIADDEAMRTVVAFGNCFAQRYPDQVLALMGTAPGSRAEAATYRQVFRRRAGACLAGDQLQMSRWIVRGAVVEGLFRSGVEIPASLHQAAPAPGTARTLTGAALCYAAGHRDQVRSLVAGSRAFSRDEREALEPMADGFFRCLVPADGEQWIHPTLLRYRLIEALLRLPPAAESSAGQGN